MTVTYDLGWAGKQEQGSSGPPPGPSDTGPPIEPNRPDGHTYDIQKSPNSSGLSWFTLTTDNNATDATADYNYYVDLGYYIQVLRDGVIWLTNLAEADRTQGGVQGQGDGHTYTLQIWTVDPGGWYDITGWIGNKAEAIAGSKDYAAKTTGKYRLVNELGQVIWTGNTMPGHEGEGGEGLSWDLGDLSWLPGVIVGLIVLGVVVVLVAGCTQELGGAQAPVGGP